VILDVVDDRRWDYPALALAPDTEGMPPEIPFPVVAPASTVEVAVLPGLIRAPVHHLT
jgi:hypothetical protein